MRKYHTQVTPYMQPLLTAQSSETPTLSDSSPYSVTLTAIVTQIQHIKETLLLLFPQTSLFNSYALSFAVHKRSTALLSPPVCFMVLTRVDGLTRLDIGTLH